MDENLPSLLPFLFDAVDLDGNGDIDLFEASDILSPVPLPGFLHNMNLFGIDDQGA